MVKEMVDYSRKDTFVNALLAWDCHRSSGLFSFFHSVQSIKGETGREREREKKAKYMWEWVS